MGEMTSEAESLINGHFATELGAIFGRHRVSAAEVARRTGYKQQQVSEYLNNKTSMKVARFVAMALAAGADDNEIRAAIGDASKRAREGAPLSLPAREDVPSAPSDLDARRAERAADRIKAREDADDLDDVAAHLDEPEPGQD